MIIPKKVKDIMQRLLDNNFEAYIIGGAIRDTILGIKPHDWDIFTNCSGKQLSFLFPTSKIIGNEERQSKILTVIVNGVEVSQYRSNGDRTKTGNTLNKHLSTCDYNVNAIACDINGNIIDKYNGHQSLFLGNFNFVGNGIDRINEDPLRLMRGLRLLIHHKLKPDTQTKHILKKYGYLLKQLPPERIRDEFMKLLKYPDSIDVLNEYAFLKYIIPELTDLIGLDDGPHHDEGDCYNHSVKAYKNSCKITNNCLIRLATLLHDIGKKPASKIIDGEITFHNHEMDSEKLVRQLMNRLKFSNKDILFVATMARLHMMGPVNKMRDVTFAKIASKMNTAGIEPEDMVVLTYSDNQANMSKVRLSFHTFLIENPFLRKYYEFKYGRKPFNKTDLEINGTDLIKLGVEPGPEIGTILQNVYDAVHDGKVINRKDRLMEYVQNEKIN